MPRGIPVDRLQPGQYWAAGPLYGETSRLVHIISVCDRLDNKARILRYAEYHNHVTGKGWHGGTTDLGYDIDARILTMQTDWRLIDPKNVLWPYRSLPNTERLVWRTTGTGTHLTCIKQGEEHEGDAPFEK